MKDWRMLHHKIHSSLQYGNLSLGAKVLYTGTITVADDEGKLNGHASYLKGQIFPYNDDVNALIVSGWLEEIISTGLIISYIVNGDTFLRHPNWEKYQSVRKDRFKSSDIPDDPNMTTKRQPNDDHLTPEREEKEEKRKNINKEEREEKEKSIFLSFTEKVIFLLKWGEEKKERKFPNPLKQKRAIEKILKSGSNVEEIQETWEEMENETFWQEKGFDFNNVLNQIGRKSKKKFNSQRYA